VKTDKESTHTGGQASEQTGYISRGQAAEKKETAALNLKIQQTN